MHKRVRCLFDEMLLRRARAPRHGHDDAARSGRLLSLDGGGIKGLVLTRILISMEKVFETPIVHCFDWIAGTSTGGILALALASGKTPLECQSIYIKLKEKVFVNSRPYKTEPLEELMRKEFGNETKMFDIKSPK
jgi:calcium-independent phospholipase A2